MTWTYAWDGENRLKWVCNTTPCAQGAAVASFLYDALGRRVEKVAGGVTTTYTYDGEDILRQIAGGSTLKYIHGPATDEPLAHEDGGGALTFFHADGLGSLVKTTSAAGAVLTTRRYDTFGNLELGATNGYSFTGREWDSETGLYYYRARYYDPRLGRFVSEDPIRTARRSLAELNAYGYVAARPTGMVDPYGDNMSQALFCLFNFNACRKASRCAEQAFLAEVMRFGGNGHNDAGDAFRHCFLSCCMAQRIGARKAQQLGNAHESFPGNPLCENKMDQLNNATGRSLGAAAPGGNCYSMCANAPLQTCTVGPCTPTGGEDYPYYGP